MSMVGITVNVLIWPFYNFIIYGLSGELTNKVEGNGGSECTVYLS